MQTRKEAATVFYGNNTFVSSGIGLMATIPKDRSDNSFKAIRNLGIFVRVEGSESVEYLMCNEGGKTRCLAVSDSGILHWRRCLR